MGKPNKSQSQKFIDLAKKVEADESEAVFDDKLKQIAKAPPPAKKSSTKEKTPTK